ncbi:High-affinity glucose transporter [Sphaceloma murrayae]|uniref:High-affinity glucose transporter n=1 Tax=Sphaceloma murrayae TaxID=2082308 RepID=A0A2K1QID1_9PEZI|nr:High-affinity glucose transporter [Sphaceloma murrayae]
MKDSSIVGSALAAVLPQDSRSWWNVPNLRKLNLILLVPFLSSSVTGYDGSLMNGLQALPAWKRAFGNPQGYALGGVNAAQSAGAIIALPLCAWFCDKFGRRWTLFFGAVLIIVASIIQSTSVNLGMFIFSRIVVGMGSSFVVQPAPLLISELCYPTHRGVYTAMFWTCFYLGAIIAAWSTFGLQKSVPNSDWAWRGPSILQAGLPIIQLLFWFKLPESPRWLIAQGQHEKARDILAEYHTAGDIDHPLVTFEMAEIRKAIEADESVKEVSWSVLMTPANRKRTLITVAIGFFSQWVGNSVISYYMTLVLNTVGITNPDTQTLINGLLQIFNFVAAICASLMVDRLGRRTLWNWSGIGMLISFIIWTVCSARFQVTQTETLGRTVIAFIFIYFFHYDIAYTPLVLSYPTEILPFSIRSKGLSLELVVIYTSLVILSFVTPIAMEAIGWRFYIVFCCLIAVSVVFNWFMLPETRGRSLEEIEDLFTNKGISQAFEEKKAEMGEVTYVDHIDESKDNKLN